MAEANANVIEMLQKLSQRFDSLQKEVETLKESDARRSANSSPPREAESSDSSEYKDRAAHRRSSGAQEKAKRRKRRHRPRSTRSRTSRSRSRSRSLAETLCTYGCNPINRKPQSSRKAARSPRHLEGDNKRPLGSKHHKGLPDRLPVQTLSKGDTSHSSVLSGAKSINRG